MPQLLANGFIPPMTPLTLPESPRSVLEETNNTSFSRQESYTSSAATDIGASVDDVTQDAALEEASGSFSSSAHLERHVSNASFFCISPRVDRQISEGTEESEKPAGNAATSKPGTMTRQLSPGTAWFDLPRDAWSLTPRQAETNGASRGEVSSLFCRILSRAERWRNMVDRAQQWCLAVAFSPVEAIWCAGRAGCGVRSAVSALFWQLLAYASEVTQPLRAEILDDAVYCLRTIDKHVTRGKAEAIISASVAFMLASVQRVLNAVLLLWNATLLVVSYFASVVRLWMSLIECTVSGTKQVTVYMAAVISDPVSCIASVSASVASGTVSTCTNFSGSVVHVGWTMSVTAADGVARSLVKAVLSMYRVGRGAAKTSLRVSRDLLRPPTQPRSKSQSGKEAAAVMETNEKDPGSLSEVEPEAEPCRVKARSRGQPCFVEAQ